MCLRCRGPQQRRSVQPARHASVAARPRRRLLGDPRRPPGRARTPGPRDAAAELRRLRPEPEAAQEVAARHQAEGVRRGGQQPGRGRGGVAGQSEPQAAAPAGPAAAAARGSQRRTQPRVLLVPLHWHARALRRQPQDGGAHSLHPLGAVRHRVHQRHAHQPPPRRRGGRRGLGGAHLRQGPGARHVQAPAHA